MSRPGRTILTALLAAVAPVCGAAEGFGVGGGVSDQINDQHTPVVTVSWLSAARHPWELSAGYLGKRDRLANGPVPATLFFAASRRLAWRGWFVSGGIALVDQDNHVLSGHGQFYTGAGYAGQAWEVSLRHLSNADTGGGNRGETFVLVEYRF